MIPGVLSCVPATQRNLTCAEAMKPDHSQLEDFMTEKAVTRPAFRRVAIVVKAPEAREVRVTGDFTRWVKQGIRLSHDGKGQWRTVLPLDPGEYQYRLLVDGEWKDHAEATERVANPFGSENCVLKVL
jgi:1,4-alpha-glucan branching enzyme